ncbi:tissue inhibitor of metalloproteinase-like [Apostichopus japonicus]|uniref:tissue inhibitor of metalloproteinase-like n=1 Tax=Stichopus japonicus TaxID=307972 RepID=UPI003AB62D47
MILLILFIGLFAISTTDACGACDTKHPQQHYCDADFAMRLKILDVSRESFIRGSNTVTAEVINSWKKGPAKGTFIFHAPASFCGTNFHVDRTYVVTGTKKFTDDGTKYWSHGSCDFGEDWDDMPAQQKKGFKSYYEDLCDDCDITPTRLASNIKVEDLENDYRDAATFWTPTNCYYNPHKSQAYNQPSNGEVEDCEDQYGLCRPHRRSGECSWQLTAEYEECFKHRDDFVIVSSGEFAITDVAQCESLPNRKKRRNCRRRLNEQILEEEILQF